MTDDDLVATARAIVAAEQLLHEHQRDLRLTESRRSFYIYDAVTSYLIARSPGSLVRWSHSPQGDEWLLFEMICNWMYQHAPLTKETLDAARTQIERRTPPSR